MLGGAISPDVSAARDEVALNEAAERHDRVADLARRYPDARIVFSGGSGTLIRDESAEAEFALRLFESFGIARDAHPARATDPATPSRTRVFSQGRSLQPRPGERWLLVTSAYHLPRAVGVSARRAFPSKPIRSIGARAAAMMSRPFTTVGDGLAANRHRGARMGRAYGLLAHRTHVRTVSGAAGAQSLRISQVKTRREDRAISLAGQNRSAQTKS